MTRAALTYSSIQAVDRDLYVAIRRVDRSVEVLTGQPETLDVLTAGDIDQLERVAPGLVGRIEGVLVEISRVQAAANVVRGDVEGVERAIAPEARRKLAELAAARDAESGNVLRQAASEVERRLGGKLQNVTLTDTRVRAGGRALVDLRGVDAAGAAVHKQFLWDARGDAASAADAAINEVERPPSR
jgi:hypothetical protein